VLRDAPERMSPEMRGYLEFGARASAQQLMRADRRIAAAAFAFERCFDAADLLVSPTVPQAGFAFGGTPPENAGTYTIPANFSGTPAISLPMGRDTDGLPLGLQICGPIDGEAAVLRAAAAFEAAAGLDMRPPGF
jgi:aspartyl-tRNA(Asn)/glutamyl-tRNA(Gln) amidotransferase subunit A